jgi:ribonuclease Z
VYANDTRPSKAVVELARDADVLIHDCTLADELIDKAKESGHSTPTEAAKVAKEAGVRQLVLIHLSPRYADDSLLLEEARRIFPNVAVAKDLMELEVKPKD